MIHERINKLDFIKIKKFCSAKENIKRIRKKSQTGRKYLKKRHLTKDSYPKYTRNS